MNFLEKYEVLKKSIPVPAVINDAQSVNCDTSNLMIESKNCYFCIGNFLEDCIYVRLSAFNKNLVDCYNVINSEKCYQSIDSNKCHSSTWLMDCINSTDCHFSAFLNSCSDCFGCVALTHKKYCIFNIQYSKEEYFKKVEGLKKEDSTKLLEQLLELKKQIPHTASQQFNNENCPYGNYIYDSKNCYWSFSTLSSENSGYTFLATRVLNCWDVYRTPGKPGVFPSSEKCYQMAHSMNNYECAFQVNSQKCAQCFYGEYLTNCTDCFGCVGLYNKKYCILNNQLTKEQYEIATREIKRELGWSLVA